MHYANGEFKQDGTATLYHYSINDGLQAKSNTDDKTTISVPPSAKFTSAETVNQIIEDISADINGSYPTPGSDPQGCNVPGGNHTPNTNLPQVVALYNFLLYQAQEINPSFQMSDLKNALNVTILQGTTLYLHASPTTGQLVCDGNVGNPNLASDGGWGANNSITLATGWYRIAGGEPDCDDKSPAIVAAACANDALVNSTPDGSTYAAVVGDCGYYDNPYHKSTAYIQKQNLARVCLNTGYGGKIGELDFESAVRFASTNDATQVVGSDEFYHPN
jgi:hypothetical protein